ncbi:hypothetical protein PT277_02160 [Acetobacteraceae bacterium ESL0709]|nr:hypothetical protein [Acetobacteraceae bacterium ESL0697]MDF7677506.1 hypothetical protein [Acetobacteraceae bacterium ESL0709]
MSVTNQAFLDENHSTYGWDSLGERNVSVDIAWAGTMNADPLLSLVSYVLWVEVTGFV